MLKEKHEEFYILPTIITYSNLALGILAISFGNGSGLEDLKLGSYLLIIAAITDKLDGYVARRYNMTSEFGKQLDSLSDLISFGMAPLVLFLNFGFKNIGLAGIIVAFLYIGCGVFRLARFNIEEDDMYIRGLPITISGLVIAIKLIIDINFRVSKMGRINLVYENISIMVLLSLLMISNYRVKKPF
ncbi:MAG: CDP-diacylglycerol--serine O-phosphatidyltransferase [Tissierellia bacterium]|nr:CDP-diacylglycerol--serine O-phosphatidyltransferase [Tissierellia bacterium]